MLKFNSIWEEILALILLWIFTVEVTMHLVFEVYGIPFISGR